MTASCTVHPLAGHAGRVRVAVSISNTTGSSHRAIVYGPALTGVTFIHPVLHTEEVVVKVGKAHRSYPGWVVPRVEPKKPAHITFHMARPAQPAAILAGPGPVIHASSWDILKNSACTVGA